MSDDAIRAQLSALQQQVEQLRAQLDALNGTVERLHTQREATMKAQLRCPACGGRRALHARDILDRTDGSPRPMTLAKVGFWMPDYQGEFECYVCVACGFVEWYVKAPDTVAVSDKVRLVEAEEDPSGPYR